MFKPQPDGREVALRLQSVGIPVQKVVRKRLSGHYTAEFFVPDMQAEVAAAAVWASAIQRYFHDEVTIINTHDTTAAWRPGNPVICAVVTFALRP
jgi:hypothetical protein